MKNSASGKSKGLWGWILICWLMITPFSRSAVKRTAWIFPQTLSSEGSKVALAPPLWAELSIESFQESLSTQIGGNLAFKYFELALKGSYRNSLAGGGQSLFAQTQGALSESGVSVEIAKSAQISGHHYGRLAVGYLSLFPQVGQQWFSFSTQTGVLSTPDFPWEFHFNFAYFKAQDTEATPSAIHVGMEVDYLNLMPFFKPVYVGMEFGVVKMIYPQLFPPAVYEDIQVTFGPHLKWQRDWGNVRFGLRWRALFDEDKVQSTADVSITPFEIRLLADLRLSVVLYF